MRKSVTILNKRGLHARASALFVKTAAGFESDITVSHNGTSVTGTSIMGLLMLAAGCGQSIELSAQGSDAAEALGALSTLIHNKFDED